MQTDDRRSFLKRFFGFFSLFVTGNLPFNFLFAGESKTAQQKDDWIAVGRIDDFSDNTWTNITSGRNIIDNKPQKLDTMVLLRQEDGISVISTRCTHMGCEVVF